VQIEAGLIEAIEFRPDVAPGISRAIIGTDSREPRNLRLDKFPIE
jgi:hypothetical protein